MRYLSLYIQVAERVIDLQFASVYITPKRKVKEIKQTKYRTNWQIFVTSIIDGYHFEIDVPHSSGVREISLA